MKEEEEVEMKNRKVEGKDKTDVNQHKKIII
jgi:hypothetical protein